MIVNKKKLCEIIGKTPQHVDKLQEKGLPHTKGGKGKPNQYDTAEVIDWLVRGENVDYQKERARLTKNQADIEELKAAQLRCELISAVDVEEKWTRELTGLKMKILAIPTSIVTLLHGIDDQAEQKTIIEKYIRDFLQGVIDEC